MGTGEESTAKSYKPSSSAQDVPATPSYADWSSSMQAYYGPGATPPSFFASTVASPTPHPYLWGSQHPLIPPYGTPVPYPAIYPPGGVYAHPSMVTTQNTVPPNTELDGKGPDGKDRSSAKKLKGTSTNVGPKEGENGKAGSGSGNDGISQSESGSEESSDASDENTNQQESAANKKGSFDQMLVEGANAQSNSSVPGKPVVSMPATNLNIRMDLYATPVGAEAAKMRHNQSGASPAAPSMDERELKRQKRKQSNRESARRSRLRKQAECEELQKRVETLGTENQTLRDELQRLSEECEKLTSENNSIKEELEPLRGPDVVSNL
ncbi:hypothetical protein L6164_027740 [Bauhinia variegata]|uniref:Uncharacterized protein n=1 Tax=Bauhinia variegata TaxID=167791 RepID=A0ACB9LU87_BAUVA|nr:hypothetical protein L6164_027740 [Bauhinia variegata]